VAASPHAVFSALHQTEQVFDFCRMGYMERRVKQIDTETVSICPTRGRSIFICREHRLDARIYLTHGSIRTVFQLIAATSLM
jgi:hypothetical protein